LQLAAALYYDELVERCKRGDARSCALLYQQYAKAMYNTSLRIVNNVADAEDVLQEAFSEAFRQLEVFNYTSTFGAWLKKIVVNRSLNALRKQRGGIISIEDALYEPPNEENIDEESIQLKVDEIKKAIALLPTGYRTVLTLYLFEAYSYDDIAAALEVTPTTVRTQYHRARLKLLTFLKKEEHRE
jgi:RNA polymerase sigma-70 factor (ECF subfamily)